MPKRPYTSGMWPARRVARARAERGDGDDGFYFMCVLSKMLNFIK
jgi:hypothetical protein